MDLHKLIVLLFFLTTTVKSTTFPYNKIHPNLLSRSDKGNNDKFNIFVTFKEGTANVIQSVESTRFSNRGERIKYLVSSLRQNSKNVQGDTVEALSQQKVAHSSFWISNQLYVKDATIDLLTELAFRDDVKGITQEAEISLEAGAIAHGPPFNNRPQGTDPPWGLKAVRSSEARELLLKATKGKPKSVIVGSIDTGVRHTHEALRHNWVGGRTGWFDPYNVSNLTPIDRNGHGSHSLSSIVGRGVGVYPDAKWMACAGCSGGSCMQNELLKCAQWMLSPGGRSEAAPHLVSNSWGGYRGDDPWFDRSIAAWHAARIVPIFSAGNSGQNGKCGTLRSPGDRDVITVGSLKSNLDISSFSSIGPTRDGTVKPDITAPGSDIIGAWNTGDDAYQYLSGTSMACPHVSGVSSLLFAYKNNLTYKQLRGILAIGARRDGLPSYGRKCGNITDNVFPNNHYGHGMVDAVKSLQKFIAM